MKCSKDFIVKLVINPNQRVERAKMIKVDKTLEKPEII